MAWSELHEREEASSVSIKRKLRKIKKLMEDVCEELEDDDEDFSERDYPMDERFYERRGVKGTGRYSRYR